jgi:hypothetical protein
VACLINDILQLQDCNTNEAILAGKAVIADADVQLVEVEMFL